MTTARHLRSSALALLVWTLTLPAHAHPRDELGQASYIGITQRAVTIELSLTPGDQLAPSFATLAQKPDFAQQVLSKLSLTLEGKPLTLKLVRGPIKTPEQSTKLFFEAPLASLSAGAHTLRFENQYAPFKSGYLATTLASTDGMLIGLQAHDALQKTLTVSFQAPATRLTPMTWIVGGLLVLCLLYAISRSKRL